MKQDVNLVEIWPYNLIADVIFDAGLEDKKNVPVEIYDIYVPAFLKCLHELSPRSQEVVIYRYRDSYTLKQLSDIFHVTSERIRQIIKKSLQILGSPHLTKIYRVSSIKEKASENMTKPDPLALGSITQFLNRLKEDINHLEWSVLADTSITPIVELDLSTRSFNCLYRAGIRNVADLANLTVDELCSIRNLGRKSAEEVILKANECGIKLRGQE